MQVYARPSWRLTRQILADLFVVAWGITWWWVGRFTDGVIRALCLVVCGGGFACGYFTLGTLTGHLWARLGERLAGKRNNRRKKRKILQEKAKKLLQSPYNILYNKLNARKRKRKRKRHLAATAAPEQRSVEYDSKFEELHEAE